MNYFILEPEVAGWFGPATTGNLQIRSPQIEKFNSLKRSALSL